MENKESEKTVIVLSKVSEEINRKIKIFQGKYGVSKKEEAMPRIVEEYFKEKEDYKLEE